MPPQVILCRCVVCCCPPGEGHNDPKWIAYEKMIDEIEAEWSGADKDAPAGRRLDRDRDG